MDKYYIDYSNATIKDNYIIPGIKGKKVNKLNSYYAMKEYGTFNENLYLFDEIKPIISIETNKDKIIKKANLKKNGVSILINNTNFGHYCEENNIKCTYVMNYSLYEETNLEIINDEKSNFNKLEKILIKNNKDTNFCFNLNINCQDKQQIEPTYTFNNDSIINYNPLSGDIIFVDKNTNIDIFKWLIMTLKYRNLNIYFLSEIISE